MKYPAKNPAKFLKPEPEPDIEAGCPAGSGFSRISGRLYRVYEKSGKINKTQKTPKKPNKTQKTQPLPYKRSDWDRVFLGYTPPPNTN